MREHDVQQRLKKELTDELAARLKIGTKPGRLVKIPDSWAENSETGKRFIPFKGTDFVWATDCIEVKVVKAKTERGMVFHVKQLNDKQHGYLAEHDGLVAVGFIKTGGDTDRLVSIVIFRYRVILPAETKDWARFDLEGLEHLRPSDVAVIRGPGYELLAR